MGRTLHYHVLNEDQLSGEHLEAMLAVSTEYNTGKFAKAWTCESFSLNPLASYPDWQAGYDWKSYEQRYSELKADGLSPLAIYRQLVTEGVAKCHSAELRGFTKVGGNEFNALLVYSALLKITELTPAQIALSDEGEFLLADLVLKAGKARLRPREIKADWRYWEKQGFLEEDKYGCRTKQEAQLALLKKYGGRYQPRKPSAAP
jgi:hypothetical protein